MALDTLANLRITLAGILKRSDLIASIPDMIATAEANINTKLDARQQDTQSTLTTTANTETVSLPTDVINVRRLIDATTSPYTVIEYLSPESLTTSYAYTTTGKPQKYTVIGGLIYLAPVPDAVYSLRLAYKAKVANLTDAAPTNFLLTSYPNVYLYATLCEAIPYMANDPRAPMWREEYQNAINQVNLNDWHSGGSMTVRTDVNR